ncbi:MAG TPA: helix-turn-helix domain-containing protein [Planctomycetota bacterium]|nr:helix-turn-helix domain-containing protein [Planctomycetota bacterium]
MKTRIDPQNPPPDETDWSKTDALGDEEIERRAASDPECPPLTDDQLKKMRRVSEVKFIRQQVGLSQEVFAEKFGLSLSSLRDWEQGRYPPDQAARTLLKLIERIPDQVAAALHEGPKTGTHG